MGNFSENGTDENIYFGIYLQCILHPNPGKRTKIHRETQRICLIFIPRGIDTLALDTTLSLSTTEGVQDHLVVIPGEAWAIWNWAWLRASGFSANLALNLAAAACGEAADRASALEEESERIQEEALSALRRVLDAERGEEKRTALSRALKKLIRGRLPQIAEPSLEIVFQKLRDSVTMAEGGKKQFLEQHQSSVLEKSVALRSIAADTRFRRAVLLQNRGAVHLGIDTLLRHGNKRGKKERQYEELIASYLQRYCFKNDTIGFFGPVGWARFVVRAAKDITASAGPELTSSSSIYFENWGIEALANKFAEDPALRPWMSPRCSPYFHLEGATLYLPGGTAIQLDALQAATLQRCTGEKVAREIALELLEVPGLEVRNEEQIYQLLQVLLHKKIISWTFEIPMCLHPEKTLLAQIRRIERENLRQPLVEALGELDRAREQVSQCVEDAEKLDRALGQLDDAFTRLTGKTSTKSAGAMYAARTLIYQECRRDLRMEIGPQVLAGLGPPLSILLRAARWFTHEAAAACRRQLELIYAEIEGKNRGRQVSLFHFLSRIESLVFDPEESLFRDVLSELQDRWARVLRLPNGESYVHYRSDELKPLVACLFPAPRAGWKLAHYHSPDLMIAAGSLDEVQKGNYSFVLGEIHMAQNTLRYSLDVSQHPAPEQLFEAILRDLPEPRVLPIAPRGWPRTTNRTTTVLLSPHDYHLELAIDSRAHAPRSRVLSLASLVIENSPQGMTVRTRDNKLRFDVIEFLGEILSSAAIDMMKILPPMRHAPRITIDRMVVRRQSWTFSTSDMPFANEDSEHMRYLRARQWMHKHNLPRFVFVRVATEIKPFYLDFDSPTYVEIFAKTVRRQTAGNRAPAPISVSEMLPSPDQLWLPDADGNTYTSEFRMVVRDMAD